MVNALASDVAVTWLGAAGTAIYLWFLGNRHEPGPTVRATMFLFGTLSVLLAVRGFFWIENGEHLGRLVFLAATLLPVAITIFVEHLLRRHHPLWLKILALAGTVFFALANIAVDLSTNAPLLIGFLVSLILVAVANAWLLLRVEPGDLSKNEINVTRAVVVAAVLAVPLVSTDFREELNGIPVRLGAIGVLIMVYLLLNLADSRSVMRALTWRLLWIFVCAALLAAAFALSIQGLEAGVGEATLRGLPVATAWLLLTAIVVRIRALSIESADNRFLRWLQRARLDNLEGFLSSLRRLPEASEHLVLGAVELRGYNVEQLFEAAEVRRDPVSLFEARAAASKVEGARAYASEQWVDLLERNGMTHGLTVSREPPRIILLNLPQGAHATLGRLRAGVIQRLARRLAAGNATNDPNT